MISHAKKKSKTTSKVNVGDKTTTRCLDKKKQWEFRKVEKIIFKSLV